MHLLKSAKIFLLFAVLLFVAKPFLGFSVFNPLYHPAKHSILVKSFTKRKLEYAENSNFDIETIQKRLAKPLTWFTITFPFLLCFMLPIVFSIRANISNLFLRRIQLSLVPQEHSYLFNGKLII